MEAKTQIIERTLFVRNGLGLHARVATSLVQAMQHFACKVTLMKDGVEVNARSVLGLLLLAAEPGSEILVRAEGPDSAQAVEAIDRLMQDDESRSD